MRLGFGVEGLPAKEPRAAPAAVPELKVGIGDVANGRSTASLGLDFALRVYLGLRFGFDGERLGA